jgi:acid phosphatase
MHDFYWFILPANFNLYIKIMKKYIILVSGILGFLFGCSSSREIINLDIAKKLVQNYYEEGRYGKECTEIINRAMKEISDLSLDNNSTVIFDVDDTALSNYEYTKQIGFGYSHPVWIEWINSGKATAIPEVKNFYNWLISKNIKVIFITGRDVETYAATRKNLWEQGYTKFDTLIVRSDGERKLPAAEYKSMKREELASKGYNIIACVGDQASDLTGKYVGIKIKLPNYLYGIE